MITQLLQELELELAPKPLELDQHFRLLIKKYHPDLNREQGDWANRKSHSIISAYKKLKPILETTQAKKLLPSTESRFTPNIQKPSKTISFQILSGNINYAIPVNLIHQIIFPSQFQKYAGIIQKIRSLSPDGCSGYFTTNGFQWDGYQYLLVLHPSVDKSALVLSADLNIADIIDIDVTSASIETTKSTIGISFSHQGERYYCPEDLAFDELIRCA